ncbi:MAG: ATP-dependent helicase HrpA, partial [Paraglaciecola sp.]
LEELGAVDRQQGQLTLSTQGKQLARLPIDPRYARMVIEGAKLNCLNEVVIIAAGLSIQDPRERPQDKRQAADEKHSEYANKESDFLALFQLWQFFKEQQNALSSNQLRRWCKSQYLNFLRMREWQDIVSQLKKSIAELGLGLSQQAADYQAIHQAMASGLLSHLGNKDKDREYLGARNSRFMVFPGSGLAKTSPKWIMVAELVETSRLFGRMAAKIEPEWVESIAQHLVKKDYSEPHWSKKIGAVQAFEKVTLYGLPLISQRRKVYSQIEPALCRDIFIREALVNLDTKLNYAFLRHNQQAVEEVEALEEKTRRRDLLVDIDTLVLFYNERLPEQICSEASFKKWWQKAGVEQPQLLHFDPKTLFKKTSNEVDEYSFPEFWRQGNIRLALNYHFEPNDPDDGVSLLIPLALLNQIQDVGFDWLIPGLRHELIISLIKSLAKKLRRNFVPAPNYADACLADIEAFDKKGQPLSFLATLSTKLKRMTGIEVQTDEWQLEKVSQHLRFNFKIIDAQGKLIKQGRNLHELQHGLQNKVKQSLQEVATPELEKSGITRWDFAELPKEFVSKNAGFEVKAYPALVAEKDSVAIKLFDKPHQADSAHQQGVGKLILLSIPSPVKYLQEKLPNKAKLGLYFNPFGQVSALIDDCIAAAIDQLIVTYCGKHKVNIRENLAFEGCCEFVRGEINDLVLVIAQKVEKGLTQAHAIKKKMKGSVPLTLINAHGDIKQHLESLVYTGFVSEVGYQKLDDWQRYIEGLVRRLEKLSVDPSRDRLHQLEIEKVQSRYQQQLQKVPPGLPLPESLKEVKWMLEELRVSFFAQQLGTSMPISSKRIMNHLGANGE